MSRARVPTAVTKGEAAGQVGMKVVQGPDWPPETPPSPEAKKMVIPRTPAFWNSTFTRLASGGDGGGGEAVGEGCAGSDKEARCSLTVVVDAGLVVAVADREGVRRVHVTGNVHEPLLCKGDRHEGLGVSRPAKPIERGTHHAPSKARSGGCGAAVLRST